MRIYSLLTTCAERKNTVFLLLFLKENVNQILTSNKDFMLFLCVCVIFLFQFEKNTMRASPQNKKASWSGLNSYVYVHHLYMRTIMVLLEGTVF